MRNLSREGKCDYLNNISFQFRGCWVRVCFLQLDLYSSRITYAALVPTTLQNSSHENQTSDFVETKS